MNPTIRHPHTYTLVANHEPSAWLSSILATVATRIKRGNLKPCHHDASPYVFMLHKPTALQCQQCAAVERRALQRTPERWRCDRCQAIHEGTCSPAVFPLGTSRGTGPLTLADGRPVLVSFGLCDACQLKEYGGVLR